MMLESFRKKGGVMRKINVVKRVCCGGKMEMYLIVVMVVVEEVMSCRSLNSLGTIN